ncbi:MAG TPA: glycosyltransferase family 1 protein [Chitinophagales bacterium]|nr:glycosyltransferase family 1 protein [Chitinophagales bacterium]
MRIGINARFLIKNRQEGLGVYTQEVSQRLAKMYPEHEWYFIFDRQYDESFITSSNITPVIAYPSARHPLLWYWWFEKSLPKQFSKHRLDMFFSTDSYLSLSAKIPQLLTVHDLAYEYFPKSIPWLVHQYYQNFIPRYCRKANQLIAISNHTKQDLLLKYQIEENKIHTIPNGVSSEFSVLKPSEIQEVKAQYTRHQPYFLYVGAVHPRKNVISILQAFEKMKTSQPDLPHQLVIVGRNAWDNQSFMDYLNKMQYRKEVIWMESLEKSTLVKIIGAATAMVYVSLYEGFGLPVLESMASGVTVITSENSPMEEIVQDGGCIVSPLDIDEISGAMTRLATDESLRLELNTKSKIISQQYHWDKTAQQTGKVIEEMLNKINSSR